MNPRFYLVFPILLLTSCYGDPSETKELHFNDFTIKVPGNWHRYTEEFPDFEMKGITNEVDSIWYEFAFSKNDFIGKVGEGHLYATDTINGFPAYIAIPDSSTIGYTRLLVDIDSNRRFMMSGYKIKDVQTVLSIFKSARFANGDTSKNPVLTRDRFSKTAPSPY